MANVYITLLVLLILATYSAPVGAESHGKAEHTSLEALVVEMADTSEEHRALASYYRDKAAAARAEAERHRSMGRHYAGTKLRERQRMQKHCDALAEAQEEAAAEYEKLAEAHAAEAGE